MMKITLANYVYVPIYRVIILPDINDTGIATTSDTIIATRVYQKLSIL